MTNRRDETEDQWRLRVAKAEAWDKGYAACKDFWIKYEMQSDAIEPENPYDRL